jgi:hypothetical protein
MIVITTPAGQIGSQVLGHLVGSASTSGWSPATCPASLRTPDSASR